MSISEPCYATREDVKSALDSKQTARNDSQVDRAIQSASRSVDGQMRRVFYPELTTKYFDWPNFQYAHPWRIWFDQAELADVTTTVPVVTSGGNTISNADIFWGNPRYAPPYTYLELDRSSSATFGQGDTPQRDIAITGVFGYSAQTAAAGTITAAVSTTTATTIAVSNSAAIGVGDNVVIDSERLLVTDKAMITTSQTQQGSGVSTASAADNVLAVTTGSSFNVGEVVLLDSERMLIIDIASNNLMVKRAWDGTNLATHSGATVYAPRTLTVTRGALGTTAATHLSAAAVRRALAPSLIKELTVGEALVAVLQESGGYAKSQGSGDNQQSGVGSGLEDIRKKAISAYGRVSRRRVI